MKKGLLIFGALVIAIAVAPLFAAFEAHVINVTAHIENALAVDAYGIDFGTVFPQEYIESDEFTIGLSTSFLGQGRVDNVEYKIVQKDKPWTLNFGGEDVDAHNRSLLCVDPDTDNLSARCVIAGDVLTITTDSDIEDLYGPNEPSSGTDWTAPRMIIPMGGNFTIETKVTADPVQFIGPDGHYQSGGILVYGSDGNIVRLELTNWSDNGNAVYMESQEAGVKVGKAWTESNIADMVYLKLTRNGDQFTGYYSADGSSWTEVPLQSPDDFNNGAIGNHPKVGLAATDNQDSDSFSAEFDYVTFNGDYLSLCRFLSKTKGSNDTGSDTEEPSYYDDKGTSDKADDECVDHQGIQASGTLGGNDLSDSWIVDLKVPPVSGYIGQEWPASCAGWIVEEDEMDYGCDLWIEVTGINKFQ